MFWQSPSIARPAGHPNRLPDPKLAEYSLCGPLNGQSHPLLMDEGTHIRTCSPLAGPLGTSNWMQLIDSSPSPQAPAFTPAPMCVSPFITREHLQCGPLQPTGYTPPLRIDFEAFCLLYEMGPEPFGPLVTERKNALRSMMARLCLDDAITDIRWIAYMLATTLHEARSAATGWKVTWMPVEETGGSGMDYGALQPAVGWDGRPVNAAGQRLPAVAAGTPGSQALGGKHYRSSELVQRRYYGRGYVQITHQDNYRAMGDALGLGNEMVARPELTLDPDIAYRIMSHGMRLGSFRGNRSRNSSLGYHGGHKLADFLGAQTDYVAARRIINGDGAKHGALIAGYAERFESILQNCRAE